MRADRTVLCVVEAVFEDMSVKKKIFQTLNKVCKKDAFLCTNTSALDIDIIADQLDDPTRCMGMTSHHSVLMK